jgi:hypothetical protein
MRFGATSPSLPLTTLRPLSLAIFYWKLPLLRYYTVHVQYTNTYSIKYRISSQYLAVPLYQNIQNISQGHFVWFTVAL